MKIQYTQCALNPNLRGTVAHLPQHRAIALIDQGAAVEAPMARRGTTEWLQDMKERSEAFNPTPLDYATVTWTVTQGAVSQRYAITAKCSRPNCTSFFFDGHPDSLCFPGTRPGSVLQDFRPNTSKSVKSVTFEEVRGFASV